MTADQPLIELVRTMAESFEDLTRLVEGLPARIDAKLVEVRSDYTSTAAALEQQMEALRADAADIRGSLSSMIGAVRAEMTDASQALRSVIGDNFAAHETQLATINKSLEAYEARVGEIAESITSVATKGEEAIAGLYASIQENAESTRKELDAQHTFISNVRTACDTVDLFAGIANLKSSLVTTNERLDTLHEAGEVLTKLVETNHKSLTSWVDECSSTVGELTVVIENRCEGINIRINELDAGIKSEVGTLRAEVNTTTAAMGATVASLEEANKSVRDELKTRITDLTYSHTKATEDLRGELREASGSVQQLAQTLDERTERLTTSHTLLAENVAAHHGENQRAIIELRAHATDLVQQVEAVVQRQSGEITLLGGRVEDDFAALHTLRGEIDVLKQTVVGTEGKLETSNANIAQLIGDLSETRTLAEMLNSRITQLGDETTQQLNAITEDLATRATQGGVGKLAEEVAQKIEGINTQFGRMLAELETSVRSAVQNYGEDVSNTVQQLSATIPPPFDPQPLRADLLAWLGERFAEHKDALPFVDFDVQTDKSELLLTFKYGDREVQRKVPLGIGIEYRGVYDKEQEYEVGNFVTHKGSMWYAQEKPVGEPGKDHEGWRLAVKCGRDGRDGKDATPARIKHVRDPATGLIKESRIGYDGEDDEQH